MSEFPRHRSTVLALMLTVVVLPAPAAAAPPDAPAGRYVALGDSYSSGQGVSPYEQVAGDTHPCRRSERAYPPIVSQVIGGPFGFWACSGAHIDHLSANAVSEVDPPYFDPAAVPSGTPNLSYLDRLGPDVSLVTVTIGGHDAGFGSVMFDCIQPGFLGNCTDRERRAQRDLEELNDELDDVYSAIRRAVAEDARVLVLGYPQLFPSDPGGVCFDGGFINESERRWLNEKAAQLNDVIRVNTTAVAGVEYVDVSRAFAGHEICGEREAYLTGMSIRHPRHSFHPNYKGHAALAEVVLDHLANVTSPVRTASPEPPPEPPVPEGDGIALFDPERGKWTLRYPDGTVDSFYYGIPGDVPLLGDWNCDGRDTVGMYRPGNGFVYVRHTNDFGVAEREFFYGMKGDVPIAGDWDGDGCDTLAIFRPSEGTVYVSNQLGTRPADFSFEYGNAGDRPFAGDFDGDGRDSVGFHRSGSGLVTYRNELATGPSARMWLYGHPDHLLVTGDWDDSGADTFGAFDGEQFRLWNDETLGVPDHSILFFASGDFLPAAGRLG